MGAACPIFARRFARPSNFCLLVIILVIAVGLLYLQNHVGIYQHETTDYYGRNLRGIKEPENELDKKVHESLNRQIMKLKSQIKAKISQLEAISSMSNLENTPAFVLGSHQYRNEYDIPSFASFTRKSVIDVQVRLIKQPEVVLPFFSDLHADLLEVIDKGTKLVNNPKMEFIEGLYRIQHNAGTQYELSFQSTVNTSAPLQLITLFRPFASLEAIASKERGSTETIYVIVPLKGRADSLRNFMKNFKSEAILGDRNVYLTVVCYGKETLEDARNILIDIEQQTNFKSYQVLEGTGEFSRGRALQTGSTNLPVDNPLMFFCDIDMFFSSHFLQQCRTHTRPGEKVFYPMVFSLYNPEVVYKGRAIPSPEDQRILKKENGFWRDFGFGMTCQYKKDFDDIGGFDLTIKGWGSEDVLLFRKYSRSPKYLVIRVPVNTLFHHWHPKHCDKSLSSDQYTSCLRSRSITEGSQIQLGMLYLENKNDS